jgi:hypothetical protein
MRPWKTTRKLVMVSPSHSGGDRFDLWPMVPSELNSPTAIDATQLDSRIFEHVTTPEDSAGHFFEPQDLELYDPEVMHSLLMNMVASPPLRLHENYPDMFARPVTVLEAPPSTRRHFMTTSQRHH